MTIKMQVMRRRVRAAIECAASEASITSALDQAQRYRRRMTNHLIE